MPTYDYVCQACDHQFELFQPITANAKKKCPECGRQKLRRLIGPGAAIMFKGSGFYTTDYRSAAYKKAAAADSGAAASANGTANGTANGKVADAAQKPAAKDKKEG
jgi:putative FmdB family regulatory protein